MKQKMSVEVKGTKHNYSFTFHGNPKYLKEWREDGLEICQIENTIPEIAVELGLTKLWCFFEDLFNFKNPFR